MKSRLRIACAVLLVAAACPAMALQLGQIQVKSSLDQPLVAAIPLHPENLTELKGLKVSLAPASDFARAGLQITPTDKTLRFHVVTDNNGQQLILVTSSQPVTEPYLDFLVQVNTRRGRQVREFVVLLNPVIAAPAPVVQAAPVAAPPVQAAPVATPAAPAAPVVTPPVEQPKPQPKAQPQPPPPPPSGKSLEFPPPLVVAKPAPKPKPKPVAAAPKARSSAQPKPQSSAQPKPEARSKPAPVAQAASKPQPAASQAGKKVSVAYGDTLYGIAEQHSNGTHGSINRLMLALKAANPKAFFKDNINDLKAGAILRIPTRDAIDKISIAEANAEVHRQYEAWRAARPHPATLLAGSATEAAARSAPRPNKAAQASDHLSLVPPTGKSGGANNRAGVAGGTGSETVMGLNQKLQNDRGTLTSLKQANDDLASRVRSLEDIAGKSSKLLSMKDATVAELQRKLADVQAGKGTVATAGSTALAATGSSAATPATAATVAAASAKAATSAPAAHSSAAKASAKAKPVARTTQPPWYMRPVAWLVAGLIVLALILIGLFSRRKRSPGKPVSSHGPLTDPEDLSESDAATEPTAAANEDEALYARLAEHPDDLQAHLALCRSLHARGDVDGFVTAAEAMHEEVVDPECPEWQEVSAMGATLAPGNPLFAQPAATGDDPYGMEAMREPTDPDATVVRTPAAKSHDVPVADVDDTAPEPAHAPAPEVMPEPDPVTALPPAALAAASDEPVFSDDAVDTKLDLARAYLDMGDPVGARAMLEEVIEEGTQIQKDEAKRLLAEVPG